MKNPLALPVLAILCLAATQAASGQNLPASMAFPDCATCGNLQFLDVSFPSPDEDTAHERVAENIDADAAGRIAISQSSAAVLSALGLICLANRRR